MKFYGKTPIDIKSLQGMICYCKKLICAGGGYVTRVKWISYRIRIYPYRISYDRTWHPMAFFLLRYPSTSLCLENLFKVELEIMVLKKIASGQ